jgi:NADH-quinone oxidoreductase subunit H
MRFALFALAEYVEIFVLAAVCSALFLGGYQLPVPVALTEKMPALVLQFWQSIVFFVKALALYYVVIWIRWTLPRIRVDRLMSICWKYLTPIAIFNLIGIAVWVVAFEGKSMVEIITH